MPKSVVSTLNAIMSPYRVLEESAGNKCESLANKRLKENSTRRNLRPTAKRKGMITMFCRIWPTNQSQPSENRTIQWRHWMGFHLCQQRNTQTHTFITPWCGATLYCTRNEDIGKIHMMRNRLYYELIGLAAIRTQSLFPFKQLSLCFILCVLCVTASVRPDSSNIGV